MHYKKHSEETKQKLREAQKKYLETHPHIRLGAKLTDETKLKISKARKKYYETHDSYWKGKKMPIEARQKISIAAKKRIGKLNPFYGKIHNNKTRQKIRESNKRRIGPKSDRWKGGITSLRDMIRSLEENKIWRKQVFQRDGYICKICNKSKSGKLIAHHIKSFSVILNEFLQEYSQFSPIEDKDILQRVAIGYKPFWDIENGIIVCDDCHKLNHSKGRKNGQN